MNSNNYYDYDYHMGDYWDSLYEGELYGIRDEVKRDMMEEDPTIDEDAITDGDMYAWLMKHTDR